ncbi:MAG: hypothetical protein ACOX2L_04150 [Anaerolineae bacterium]|jgi:hypothetical protein|nr:hypothetical protein [Chloroflexota bacterium]
MTTMGHSILQYESALSRDAQRRIRKMGTVDLVIGIPSHRNGRTIGEVIDALVAGVRAYYPDLKVVLINADGGSSDNTVKHIQDADVPDNVTKLVTIYEGVTGKGTAIRSVLEAAWRLGARACVIAEARAIGIQPEWLPALVSPILHGDEAVLGCYQRAAMDAALTDNLVYPFMSSFWSSDLVEPLAPEFALSGELATSLAECDVWETNVARFGVNMWMTLHMLSQRVRMAQVDLGYRGPAGGEPAMPGDQRFVHTVGTLFRALTTYRRSWTQGQRFASTPFRGLRSQDRQVASEEDLTPYVDAFQAGRQEYGDVWESVLQPETFDLLQAALARAGDVPALEIPLWVRLVYEFAAVFNRGEGDPDKVIEALLPLYYGRAVRYANEVEGLTVGGRAAILSSLATAFSEQRPAFETLWNSYQEWEDDVTRYWIP